MSEHHGDGCPGSHVRAITRGVAALQAELIAKRYNYGRPGLERTDRGTLEVNVQTRAPSGSRSAKRAQTSVKAEL